MSGPLKQVQPRQGAAVKQYRVSVAPVPPPLHSDDLGLCWRLLRAGQLVRSSRTKPPGAVQDAPGLHGRHRYAFPYCPLTGAMLTVTQCTPHTGHTTWHMASTEASRSFLGQSDQSGVVCAGAGVVKSCDMKSGIRLTHEHLKRTFCGRSLLKN